jgi:PAS domain S-box-containing protein
MKNAYPKTKNRRANSNRGHNTTDKEILNLTSSKNNGFFHLLAENARDLIFHAKVSPTYRFDYVSPSSTYITGYTPEEFYADPLIAKKCILEEDFHLVSDPSKWSDPHNNRPIEIRWRHKNGKIIWTEHMISTTLDKNGKPESFNIIARDITERKQAEAALLESQQFTTSLLENAPNATVVINPDTSVKYVNPAWERLNGWTLPEIAGTKIPYPWWPPQFKEAFSEGFMEAMRQGSGKSEIVCQKKNGELYWIDMNWASVTNNGELLYLLINSVDITERKKMEDDLRESEEKFSKAFSSSPNPVCIVTTAEGTFIDVNDSFLHFTGHSREEVIGHTPFELGLWVNKGDLKKIIKTMKETGRLANEEIKSRMKSGKIRTGLISAETIDIGGKKCVILVITDITEQVKVKEALRESEEKFSKAFHASPNSISISRLDDGKFIDVNDTFIRDKGYSREDIIGRTSKETNIWVDFKERARIMNMLKKQGHIHNEEVQYRTKSGKIRTGLLSAEILNINNEPCVLMINSDITRQRLAEKQLRLLGLVTEQVSDATIITDPHFNITYMNKAAQDLFGYNINDLKGKNLATLNKTQPSPEIKKSIRKILDNGGIYNSTVAKKRKDGATIICDCRISPLYDEHGNITSIIDVQRDVTEQQEVEAKLQEHKKLIESILATTPEGVLVINNKNRILLANKALHKIFHLNNRSLKNKLFSQIFPVKQFYDLHKAKKRINTDKNTLEFRYQVQNTEKIIYCVIVKMDRERTLLTFSDVSREREEEEKLYLTDRLASIGEMAAGLAHELNNPLTGILALTQLLTSSNLPDDYKDDLECISTEAKRAADIVKNVLLFARSKTDENGHSSVNDVVKDVLRLREYEERSSDITVTMNLEENLPDIPIDKGQLQQVFLNLFSNAEAAIKEANRPGTITVATQRVNNHININFSDNGCGIKKQAMSRIFDPFFTTKEIGKGTGLGLSICYSIIIKHGGKINVKSNIDKGTTFTIKIPIVT